MVLHFVCSGNVACRDCSTVGAATLACQLGAFSFNRSQSLVCQQRHFAYYWLPWRPLIKLFWRLSLRFNLARDALPCQRFDVNNTP